VLKILLVKVGLEAEKHSLNASGSKATPRYFKDSSEARVWREGCL